MKKNDDLKSKILLMRKKNFGEDELLNEENLKETVSKNIMTIKKNDAVSEINQFNTEDEKINKEVENKYISSKVNEKAFNLLANKFNESVEVILELNKRVEKLETLVRLQSMQDYKKELPVGKKSGGIKFFIFLMILSGLSYFIYNYEINLSFLKEIFEDYSVIFKK